MRARLEKNFIQTLPRWKQNSKRLSRLAVLYAWLDNKIYDCLHHEYNDEFTLRTTGHAHNPQQTRKPSTRLNAAGTAARNVSRKLFAGRHAPTLQLEGQPEKLKLINKILKEGRIHSEMMGLVKDASVGSGCILFKIVTPEGDSKPRLVLQSYRTDICFPEFDIAKQLSSLRIAYTVPGNWYLSNGYKKDSEGNEIKPEYQYWYVKILDKTAESYLHPILSTSWNPVSGESKLERIAKGELAPVEHKLGFVPAHWFINLTGGEFPDGGCTFEPGLDNATTYDYEMSQLDLGIKNSACPITVISGTLAQEKDEQGRPIPKTPSRHLQFEAAIKGTEMSQEGGKAYYLESNGQSFQAGLEVCRQIKKDMSEQMSASRKDPDKVTTAMSGKGIELIEEEFMDMVFELRTNYGEEGYLPMVRKILKAAILANHPLVKGLNESDVDNLELEWPDMHDMTPAEFQQTVAGLQQGYDSGLISLEQGQETYKAKVDVATHGKSPKKPPEKPTATKKPTK